MGERAHVVPVVGHPHLWSNEQDLPVVEDDPDVIDDVLVGHGPASSDSSEVSEGREKRERVESSDSHSNVANDVLSDLRVDDLSEDFPRVKHGVACDQIIRRETGISGEKGGKGGDCRAHPRGSDPSIRTLCR